MKSNSAFHIKKFWSELMPVWRFIFFYWLLWIAFFEIGRLVFLFANYREWKQAGITIGLQSLRYGLLMDMSMSAYLALPVIIFQVLGVFILFFRKSFIYHLYNLIILILILLLIIADISLYKAWGNRIDASPLIYLKNPIEVWASISHLPLLWISVGYIILVFLISRLFYHFVFKQAIGKNKRPTNKILLIFSLLILAGLFIIPLRGGFQLAPINQSSVYFSSSNFANLAALNAPWNFMYSLNHNTSDRENPFIYYEANEVKQITDSLFFTNKEASIIPNILPSNKPNVILIIWESFTAKVLDSSFEGKEITPGFSKLKNEGIYFSNIYASGDRTDKGIVAVLSGYPSQPTTSIVKIPSKAAKLPALGKLLYDKGYNNSFYYGGELEFANLKAYLLNAGYQRFVSINNFNKEDQNSKWGAHDGIVAKRIMQNIGKEKSPFFYTWMTLSSHEPFETPVEPYFLGKDDKSLFLNSLHYTDSCVTSFINFAKKQPWWSNTIVMIVADHGHRLPRSNKKEYDFKIPMLMTGGAIKNNLIHNNVGGQTDLPATLWAQLAPGADNPFRWSKNLLDSSTLHWAYFSFNNGFGFVSDSSMFIYDNVGKQIIDSRGKIDGTQLRKGKGFLQSSFQDYLDK